MAAWWESAPLAQSPAPDDWYASAPQIAEPPRYEGAASGLGGAVEGMPIVGPYLKSGSQKAAAAIRAHMNGTNYEDELKAVQEYAAQSEKKHPNSRADDGVTHG